jgi:hypothetical protein
MAPGPDPEPSRSAAALQQLPQDALVPDIARQLEDSGEYRATFVPTDPQRLVDLRWAALGAGRLLGRRVHVAVTRAGIEPGTSPITVRMTCAPSPRPAARRSIPRQRRDRG